MRDLISAVWVEDTRGYWISQSGGAPLPAGGGEGGLHRGESFAGYEDVPYYGPLPPGGAYGRTPPGGEAFGPR